MEEIKSLFNINLFGYNIGITSSIIIQWIIILIVAVISIVLTKDLKRVPDRKQSILESFVQFINNLVGENMGSEYKNFSPYIGTLFIFILLMNLTGLIGIKPPTGDINIALGLAAITFFIVQFNAIKKVGIKRYLLGYGEPFLFLLPLNLLERIMLPISLSLRLFGNMTAAVVVIDIIYNSLARLGWFAQIGIPIPAHAFFDVFDGVMQMFIFTMLTMINIKIIAEH
ncbi:ATP synthase subunit a [Clostridium acetireducens DSM 10703]|uniref:ATP synthase subunit a n=1 Tax=Clostridium acetireducens DSM 10703 TaxID=1121290 RepID=A0A1E8EZR1_9CLOT|nr:F0F1 ATP synthase subunit A [Clostridium acetireducens]OFI06207.1 ATP synthase subunit a [Clostridium acetireducens DSM 10703]